jgi:hypothetical protein
MGRTSLAKKDNCSAVKLWVGFCCTAVAEPARAMSTHAQVKRRNSGIPMPRRLIGASKTPVAVFLGTATILMFAMFAGLFVQMALLTLCPPPSESASEIAEKRYR